MPVSISRLIEDVVPKDTYLDFTFIFIAIKDYSPKSITKALKQMGKNAERSYEEMSELFYKWNNDQTQIKGDLLDSVEYQIADAIIKRYDILVIEENSNYYVYDNGIYRDRKSNYINKLITDTYRKRGHKYTRAKRNTFIYFIVSMALRKYVKDTDTKTLNLRNGLLDLDTLELREHKKDYISFVQIPHDYDPKAKCPKILKYIKEWVKSEDLDFIQEWCGYCAILCSLFNAQIHELHHSRRIDKRIPKNDSNMDKVVQ